MNPQSLLQPAHKLQMGPYGRHPARYPCFSPSGVQLVLEAAHFRAWRDVEYGVKRIPIEGRLLENGWHHLARGKENFIREKDKDGEPRTITVEPWQLKGYSKEPKE